jgi:hypothetical protein
MQVLAKFRCERDEHHDMKKFREVEVEFYAPLTSVLGLYTTERSVSHSGRFASEESHQYPLDGYQNLHG